MFETFIVSLGCMVLDEVCFCPYEGHRQTRPFDVISLYSGWMGYGTSLMYHYLPERVMRQFGYLQIILRPPYESAILGVCCRDLQEILDDFESNLVLYEYHRDPSHVHWACVKGYLTCFYSVSHPIMTPDTLGEPPRLAKLEVLEVQDE